MKSTVIIVLASVLASYFSFISALARPKLSASRIQMTIKMSNGMASKIKTMAGLMTAGLMTVSTPAWAQDAFKPMIGPLTGIKLPNQVKLTFKVKEYPEGGFEPSYLYFQCPTDASKPARALVIAPEAETKYASKFIKLAKLDPASTTSLSGICATSGVEVYLPDPTKDIASGELSKTPVFVSRGGNLKIDRTDDGFWTIK